MFNKIVAHTSFLGHTGYANHSREFFTHLNDYIKVRVRNFSHCPNISYLTPEQKKMVIYQRWQHPPWEIGEEYIENKEDDILHIILNETNHYFFYDKYFGPKIAYNVWESTRQPETFFKKLLEFDQLWVPTEWQKKCSIEQGYPEDRVKVVHEGVDENIFYPESWTEDKPMSDTFRFLVFGRWDYRKSIEEIIRAFTLEFKEENIELLISVDNPFTRDGLNSTEERLEKAGIHDPRIKILHFPPFEEYVKYLRSDNHRSCLVTCSRSEGWNLPLIEAMACGTPTICSNYGAQLEFASKYSNLVDIKEMRRPKEVFMFENDNEVPGEWSEPDFNHLQKVMRHVYENYNECKEKALEGSEYIRREFSWDKAVEKAVNEIEKFHKEYNKNRKSLKLNLGCGNDIKDGYINIDRYNNKNAIDINCDIRKLPFEDESVKEILISHTLEHFKKDDVLVLLKEFNRVLEINGWLEIRVPDFNICVNKWRRSEDKWDSLDQIFGSQTHKGNSHHVGFTKEILSKLAEEYGFFVSNINTNRNIYNEYEIVMLAQKARGLEKSNAMFNCNFVNGPFLEILDNDNTRQYRVEFYDKDNESMVHSTILKGNHWTRPFRKYYTNWQVKVKEYGETIYTHDFNLYNKRVLIYLDSKSLGDTIAWFPYIEEFRKKHKCEVIASTFWNKLFEGKYPDIKFIKPGTGIDNLYASFSVGCRDDLHQNKNRWMTIPLQQVASDYLGLKYKETKPILNIPDTGRKIKGKYVCITEHSTAQMKYWNFPNGWQSIVDYLRFNGYKVVVISKEQTKLKNIINKTNRPIEETIANLKYASCLIVGSSGLAWLAWTMNIPVIMITGITEDWCEFQTGIRRVQNKEVCHGCFNDPQFVFDKGDWQYCPLHKGTNRHFECTKKIHPKMVRDTIKEHLSI